MITGSVRVSSDEQKKHGQQVNAYISSIHREGVLRENIIIELARSGSMDEDSDMTFELKDGKAIMEFDLQKKRPDLYRWLEDKVMKGLVEKHYINKWDRLSRNVPLGIWLMNFCKKYDTEIYAVNDTNDKKMIYFSLVMAELESILTKERVNYNKLFKFDKGLYMGTSRIYGYKKSKIVIDGREYLNLVPDEKEKQMILDVFSDIDYKEVCEKWNINPTTYYSIKQNRFYCGYIKHKNKERKGIHEPIISEEVWEKYNKK